jgi:hypothetical protein
MLRITQQYHIDTTVEWPLFYQHAGNSSSHGHRAAARPKAASHAVRKSFSLRFSQPFDTQPRGATKRLCCLWHPQVSAGRLGRVGLCSMEVRGRGKEGRWPCICTPSTVNGQPAVSCPLCQCGGTGSIDTVSTEHGAWAATGTATLSTYRSATPRSSLSRGSSR